MVDRYTDLSLTYWYTVRHYDNFFLTTFLVARSRDGELAEKNRYGEHYGKGLLAHVIPVDVGCGMTTEHEDGIPLLPRSRFSCRTHETVFSDWLIGVINQELPVLTTEFKLFLLFRRTVMMFTDILFVCPVIIFVWSNIEFWISEKM